MSGHHYVDSRPGLLKRLWGEVCALPIRQRHALLLNLRDEQRSSALLLLPRIGIASFADIANVLDMTDEELHFIWNDLPMDDLQIARRLGLTRQQVINLRKTARARLIRRMA